MFEQDHTASDILLAVADEIGDGTVMDALRQRYKSQWVQVNLQLNAEIERLARKVKAHNERHVIPAFEAIPDFEIPRLIYDEWAFEYKERCLKAGIILSGNGYEWMDDEDECEKYRRQFPQLVYKEVPRTTSLLMSRPSLAS
jgi:hypothetical protein